MSQNIKKYLEYKILITPDTRIGSRKRCLTAYVPVLGIATSGDTVEETFINAKELIAFHLESLHKEGRPFPLEDTGNEFVATARIAVPA